MKKSSLVSIVAHSFLLIVLSFSQNFSKNPSLGLMSLSVVEIINYSGETNNPELHKVDIAQGMPTNRLEANVTTAPENLVSSEETAQIQDTNIPIHPKQSDGSSVPVLGATITKAFPKFQNVERNQMAPNTDESYKLEPNSQEEYFQQYEFEESKGGYATDLFQSGNQIRSGSGQRIKETAEVVKTVTPEPQTHKIAKLSLPSPKPSRIKNISPQSAKEKLPINDANSETSKKRIPIGDIDLKSTPKPLLRSTPASPKLAMSSKEKSGLNRVLLDKKKSLVKNGNDIHIGDERRQFTYAQTFEMLAQSRSSNSFKNNHLPQSRKPVQFSGMKKTLDQSTQTSCKRTLTVAVPKVQQVDNIQAKKLLTINDLLGQQRSWNTARQQVTISYLLGTNNIVRQNKQGNVSISELLKGNVRVTHANTTVCIE